MSIELRVIDYMKGWLAGSKSASRDGGKRPRHFCGVDYERGYDAGCAAYVDVSRAEWDRLQSDCASCGGVGRMPPEGFRCPECHGTGKHA